MMLLTEEHQREGRCRIRGQSFDGQRDVVTLMQGAVVAGRRLLACARRPYQVDPTLLHQGTLVFE
jgi:hypothetical protein